MKTNLRSEQAIFVVRLAWEDRTKPLRCPEPR